MHAVLLALTLVPVSSASLPVVPALVVDAEYDKRKNEAGKDVTKLWKLYEWCVAEKRDKDVRGGASRW